MSNWQFGEDWIRTTFAPAFECTLHIIFQFFMAEATVNTAESRTESPTSSEETEKTLTEGQYILFLKRIDSSAWRVAAYKAEPVAIFHIFAFFV